MRFFLRRPILFILVGSMAAITHLLTVILVVEWLAIAPLIANVVGWLCAFGISYAGHFHLTFSGHTAPVWQSARRFFVLSVTGFLVNESAYALLLHISQLPYYFLLGLILLAVAIFTYLLSRQWAFQGKVP